MLANGTDNDGTDSEATDYHPRSKRTQYLHIRISAEDRAALARLTHRRRTSAAEVVRSLIVAAAAAEIP